MLRAFLLTTAERQTLEALRDHGPKPYLRERATALLKVDAGMAPAQVARDGLLRPRKADTVYVWLDRFTTTGLAGLYLQPGRGRKPAFSPQHATEQAARAELQHLVHRSPRALGLSQTRWTLAGLRATCLWLWPLSLAGVHQLLTRLGIVWKRARDYVHSPDPHYMAKQAVVIELCQQPQAADAQHVVVYLDEVTIGRQPTVVDAYVERGHAQARAQRSHQADTLTRVVATLDHTGRVVFRRATKITLSTLVQFYQDLRAAYPAAARIYVVQDNWPVHTHPDVLVALEPQTTPFAWHRPRSWPTEPSAAAVKRWGQLQLPIQIVPLPTYASWLNPIEKLWRKLRQEVTHLHPWADDLARLRAEVDVFLAQFAHGSAVLRQYVGLGIPN